jgi:hypothetical protein
MVTGQTVIPMAVIAQRPHPGPRATLARAASPSRSVDPPESVRGAGRDADALVWDLTVHRLHRAFAECLAAVPEIAQCGQPQAALLSPAGGRSADVRLAATRHAVNEIQDALRRMAAGSYGVCQQCAQPITAERLRAAPITRWCLTCQADRCG